MKIDLPWLSSRKELIFLSLLDSFIFIFIFSQFLVNIVSEQNSLSYSLLLLLLFWLVTSYVLDRYYPPSNYRPRDYIIYIFKIFTLIFTNFVISIFYFWSISNLIGFDMDESFGLIINPYIYIAFSSSLSHFLLYFIFRKSSLRVKKWILLGSKETENKIKDYLNCNTFDINVLRVEFNYIYKIDDFSSINGFILESPDDIDYSLLEYILSIQQNNNLEVFDMFSWYENILQRFPPQGLTYAHVLSNKFYIPSSSIQLRIKRIGDIFVSLFLLILTIPCILFVSLLIYLEDKGPIFYSQIRVGKNSKLFTIYKLRTMSLNSEAGGAKWASSNDPRVTKIGKILRATRIDELPQLISVIKGEMSLIGPRPERPEFERTLIKDVPHYSLRHAMRPGLSGWAQVNYPYGASVEDTFNKLSYDLYYLKNFSFLLDVLILLKTIRLVFNAKGSTPLQK